VESNAKHSFEQRFRVLKPTSKAIGEALQNALNLAEEPRRIESFDILTYKERIPWRPWWFGKKGA